MSDFLGRGVVGFANPGIGNHGSVGKVVQFLQKYLTCYNSRAHGYKRSGSFMISGYYGWLGLDYSLLPLGMGLFTKVVIQDAKT